MEVIVMPQLFISYNWPELVKRNIEQTRSFMKKNSIQILICQGMENVRYLTGFSPFNAMIMEKAHLAIFHVDKEQPTIFTLPYPRYIQEVAPWIKDSRTFKHDMVKTVLEFFYEYNINQATVAVDSFVSYYHGQELVKQLTNLRCNFINLDIMPYVRAVKNEEEIKIIKEAVAVAETGMKAALDACIEGVREYEVAAAAEYVMRLNGAEAPAFASIVSSGENGAACKEISSDKLLRFGEIVLLDLGCLYEGYNAEYARTAYIGKLSLEQKEMYRVVYEAEQECIKLLKPGTKCSDIDQIGRQVIREAGFGQWESKYSYGHGIGMSCWDLPDISPNSEDVLEPGMVVNVEPGIHKPGVGGIRLEDIILITETGHEVLTKTPFCDI